MKFNYISSLNADVYIIQECEDPAQSTGEYRSWASDFLWVGSSKSKGLGIFTKSDHSLKTLNWDLSGLAHFLPCSVNGTTKIIGVWTKCTKNPRLHYVDQIWGLLRRFEDDIADQQFILAGDFNSNACWDKKYGKRNHSQIVKSLEILGYQSVYHAIKGEQQGDELEPTLIRDFAGKRAYHIDYVFAKSGLIDSVQSIEVGKPWHWRIHSDHMPVVLNF